MRMWRLLSALVIAALAISVASAQSLVTVYSHDFESPVGPEWSKRDREITPIGYRTFLGQFSGEPVWLELHDLPDHCRVRVTFELFVINSWEGSVGWNAGPDVWDLNVSNGPPNECLLENLLHATFANCVCDFQSYPDRFPNVHNPGLTDADEVNTLGYVEDSVYYLSYSFYHDTSDLYFAFQGSPDLQGLDDESWGIDNIVVQMDTDERYCCRAVRAVPTAYGPGGAVPVYITAAPDPRTSAYVVEETPPSGWQIDYINEGGVFEAASGAIKWGPFFDEQTRLLTYRLVAPLTAFGSYGFEGVMSVDGESEPVCGDMVVVPGGYHPADLDSDWRLEANELTAYAAAWVVGDPWTNDFHPITVDLVTNAGLLWKSGEVYVFDASYAPPWRPTGGYAASGGEARSSAVAVGGGGVELRIAARPHASTRAWAVEERLPAGWEVSAISHGGRVEPGAAVVKWGPFFDQQARELSYVVRPVDGAAAVASFAGVASFDGRATAVSGVRVLGEGESAAQAAD